MLKTKYKESNRKSRCNDNLHELELPWGAEKPDEILDGEEAHGEVVDDPDDGEDDGQLHDTILVLLELVHGGDDEGDGGDKHHGQGEEGTEPDDDDNRDDADEYDDIDPN